MHKTLTTAVLLTTLGVAAPAGPRVLRLLRQRRGGEMFNDATQVVLMRKGTRTVLSMQNNYKGPPEEFAMVIPVPTVLQKEDVKTLPKDVFARVEADGRAAAGRVLGAGPVRAASDEYDRPAPGDGGVGGGRRWRRWHRQGRTWA
jgi:hypothetical protein